MIKVALRGGTFGGLLAGVMLLLMSKCVTAGGFYIGQKGTVGVELAGAGTVALAQDGSTLYFNPAGVTELDRAFVQFGIDAVKPISNISNQGSTATMPGTLGAPVAYAGAQGAAGDWVSVPNLYAASPVFNKDLWLGLAITSPFGLKLDYSSDWFGRYDSIDNKLTTIDIAPTIAYRINEFWSIGAGVDIQYADLEFVSALPNTLNPGGPTPATDGSSKVTGTNWRVGYNAGIMFHANGTRIGVEYRSKIDHTLQGNTTISGLAGPLAAGNGNFATSTNLSLPQIVSLGIARDVLQGLTLLGEVDWYGWDSFQEIQVHFANGNPDVVRPENFRNTFGFAFGAQYKWTEKWTVRSGVRYEQTPTVNGFRNTGIPDSNATIIGIGAGYMLSERLALDFGYSHVFYQHANINLTLPFFAGTAAAGSVLVSGRTDNSADTLSLSLRYGF